MIMLDEQDQFVSNGQTQVKIQPGYRKVRVHLCLSVVTFLEVEHAPLGNGN
jgi:hypothetical protein